MSSRGRHGRSIEMHCAGEGLRELFALTGWDGVVRLVADLGPRGQTEDGEQRVGVEEVVEPDDLTL
jgi:hypothetical protein